MVENHGIGFPCLLDMGVLMLWLHNRGMENISLYLQIILWLRNMAWNFHDYWSWGFSCDGIWKKYNCLCVLFVVEHQDMVLLWFLLVMKIVILWWTMDSDIRKHTYITTYRIIMRLVTMTLLSYGLLVTGFLIAWLYNLWPWNVKYIIDRNMFVRKPCRRFPQTKSPRKQTYLTFSRYS